jgi:hypothetical protein
MRLPLVVLLTCVTAAAASAQPIPAETIRNQELGWMSPYDASKPAPPAVVDHRKYSSAQLAVGQLFATWMQATYSPIGGLGGVQLSASEKLGLYNQNTAALPQSYGALARIYTDLKYGANKKIERASNSHIVWSIMANGFIGEAADALSTPQRYFFTMPTLAQQSFGGEELEKKLDLSRHPVLGRFPSYLARNSVNGNRKFILIAKDGRLPYRVITKGEYLAALEAAVTRLNAAEMAKVLGDANKKFIAAVMPDVEAKHAKRLAVLAANKERYRNRLQEPAEIWTMAPDGMLENVPDVFEGNGGTPTRLKVYTIDPEVVERAKGDEPLWIVVGWTAEIHDPVIKHLHDAVITKFNFDYVYNYFFDPGKVKGVPYTPLR